MFTGQLSWTDTSDRTTQLMPRPNVVNGDRSGAEFALLFSEVLAITNELGAESGQSGLTPELDDYGGSSLASGPALRSGLLSRSSVACLTLPASMMNNLVAIPDVDTNLTAPNLTAGLDREKLASWMDAHALACSSHHCALFCRLGMEAAGMSTADRPLSGDAADYGPFLLRHGAHVVPLNSYTPQVGDTVIFDKTAQHPNGHMEMYDGCHWVSDFMQHSFSPYRDAASTPSFTIYRLT
jgi:hypothetical protein